MINFSLPNFHGSYLDLNLFFISLFSTHPDWMRKNVCVKSVYGCFPSFDLNGGRENVGRRATRHEMEETFSRLAQYGVFPRITCSNQLVTKDDLNDPYSKQVLETAAKYNGQAIVYLDEIGKAIKETYGMPIILTTNRHLKTAEDMNEACKVYDMVVLNYRMNQNLHFIGQLKYPERVEIMANELCSLKCTHRDEHSLAVSKVQLQKRLYPVPCRDHSRFEPTYSNVSLLSPAQIEEVANKFNITYFKIVARDWSLGALYEHISKYLVVPKHLNDVTTCLKQLNPQLFNKVIGY